MTYSYGNGPSNSHPFCHNPNQQSISNLNSISTQQHSKPFTFMISSLHLAWPRILLQLVLTKRPFCLMRTISFPKFNSMCYDKRNALAMELWVSRYTCACISDVQDLGCIRRQLQHLPSHHCTHSVISHKSLAMPNSFILCSFQFTE